jgi:orotate phosphoribosyltransferase
VSQARKTLIDLTRAEAGEDWADLDLRHLLYTGRRLRSAALVLSEWIELHVTEIPSALVCPFADEMLVHAVVSRAMTDMKWVSINDVDHNMSGGELTEADAVVILAGMVTTGATVRYTHDTVIEEGASVLAIIPLIDAAGTAQGFFESIGVDYWPVLTHYDLDLPPLAQAAD